MLATIAALQLVLLSQVAPPPREVAPDEAQASPAPENPPLPAKGEKPASAAAPARPRQLSLLSGESLGGGAVAQGWLGWSSLGVAYAQGITREDDLGGFVDYDWASSEFRLGVGYRRPLGRAGVFDMGGRLSAAWYENFGSKWIYGDNHSDRGLEVVPGLSFSEAMGGGIFSMLAEAPLTITTKYGSGLLFSPRFSVAYEAPLYPALTLGARLGVGYRAGSGDAPMRDGSAYLMFLVVGTYNLL